MIPGLLDQIRLSLEDSFRTVLIEKQVERAAQIAHESSRNAAQGVVFILEEVLEELIDARNNINEATRALDTCGAPSGVDGKAYDLADRIRLLATILKEQRK